LATIKRRKTQLEVIKKMGEKKDENNDLIRGSFTSGAKP